VQAAEAADFNLAMATAGVVNFDGGKKHPIIYATLRDAKLCF
jgi:hypothetical protein